MELWTSQSTKGVWSSRRHLKITLIPVDILNIYLYTEYYMDQIKNIAASLLKRHPTPEKNTESTRGENLKQTFGMLDHYRYVDI